VAGFKPLNLGSLVNCSTNCVNPVSPQKIFFLV
jgi:hypothetical protein